MRPSEALLLRWRDVQIKRRTIEDKNTGKKDFKWGAVIQISPDTKTGRREVICPAGVFFNRIHKHYTSHGFTCKKDDLIFRNIGTKNSRADQFVGQALTLSFLRKLGMNLLLISLHLRKVIHLLTTTPFTVVGASSSTND